MTPSNHAGDGGAGHAPREDEIRRKVTDWWPEQSDYTWNEAIADIKWLLAEVAALRAAPRGPQLAEHTSTCAARSVACNCGAEHRNRVGKAIAGSPLGPPSARSPREPSYDAIYAAFTVLCDNGPTPKWEALKAALRAYLAADFPAGSVPEGSKPCASEYPGST